MKIIEPGHVYELDQMDQLVLEKGPKAPQFLTFVNREPGHQHPGTQTQEVLRALIDRTFHCHACMPWHGNEEIIYHLRMALVLHEMRALQRKVEEGRFMPEHIPVLSDGHYPIPQSNEPGDEYAPHWNISAPYPRFCSHREYSKKEE